METFFQLTACCDEGDCASMEAFMSGIDDDGFTIEWRESLPGVLNLEGLMYLLEEEDTFGKMAALVRFLYLVVDDTSEAPVRKLAFRDGKRTRPATVLSAMEKNHDLGSQGIAALVLKEKKEVANNVDAALRKAIRDNWKIDRVAPLLEQGADVNGKADDMSFLEYAICNQNIKVALALLQRGAGKDKPEKVLYEAVSMALPSVAKALLETYQLVPAPKVLHEAIYGNKPNTIRLLLKHGADPQEKYRGTTAVSAVFKYFDYCDDKRIESKKKILALLLVDDELRAVFQKNIGRYIGQIRRNANKYEMPCAQKLIDHLEAMR